MLRDKVIVIVGGAGLIGKQFVKAVIENSGIAIIADINETIGLPIKDQISKEMGTNNVDFVKIDITRKDSLVECIHCLDIKYGRIDALVNSAYPRNKSYGKDFFDVEYQDFCENININLGGFFLTSQLFAKYFIKQGYGKIINIASIYGVVSPRFELYEDTHSTMPVEYAAIKSSVIHLTKYMAKKFKDMNINVNAISPGGILHNQSEEFVNRYNRFGLNKGMLDNNDLNGTLIFLVSDMSKFINGQNIVVDDGWSL